jgi:hypothetical protein
VDMSCKIPRGNPDKPDQSCTQPRVPLFAGAFVPTTETKGLGIARAEDNPGLRLRNKACCFQLELSMILL